MKERDNSKINISSNFILSVSLLIMFVTLLLRPSLHCNTSLHFTTIHPTTLHYAFRQFISSHYTSLTSHLALSIMLPSSRIRVLIFTALKILISFNILTHVINPLKTKPIMLYLKTQSVPRCKHFSSRL